MTVRVEQARAHLERMASARREAGARHEAALRARLPAAVALLRERHGVGRAWLFGSLAEGRASVRSDVDLAVEGLPSADYFPALGDLMQLLRAPVDLVRIEEAGESLRTRIEELGEPL